MKDTVPTMLTPGEVVLNDEQQVALGSLLGTNSDNVFNAIGVPGFESAQKFQDGGVVQDTAHTAIDDLILMDTINKTSSQGGFNLDRPGGYSIGVRDEEAIKQNNAQDLMGQLQYLMMMKDRYPNKESFNAFRKMKEQEGSIPTSQGIEDALNTLFQNRYGEEEPVQKFQYGGEVEERESLQDLYDIYGGGDPLGRYQQRFEEMYDVSDEVGQLRQRFGYDIESLRQSGEVSTGKAFSQYGGGQSGFGAKGAKLSSMLGDIRGGYERGLEKSYGGYETGLSDIYEGAKEDIFSSLGVTEEAGGLVRPGAAETTTKTEGEQQIEAQEDWYALGFPDEASYDLWMSQTGGDMSQAGAYGQSGQDTLSNLNETVGLSDIRLKNDINYIFTLNNDIPFYTFKYNWSDDIHIGTMAQDIEGIIPDAVRTNEHGYKMVDYAKVFNYGK